MFWSKKKDKHLIAIEQATKSYLEKRDKYLKSIKYKQ